MSEVAQPVKQNYITRIGSLLPQIAVIIIAAGFVKQLLFFKAYRIPIKYFLTLSEVGLIVSDHTLYYVPFIILVWYGLDVLRRLLNNSKDVNATWIGRCIKRKFFKIILICIAVILLVTFAIKYFYLESGVTQLEWIRTSIWIIALATAIISIIEFILLTEIKLPIPANIFIPYILATYSLFILYHTQKEYTQIQNGRYTNTKIYIKDSLFHTSDKNSYFIGKTDKYIFIHNRNYNTVIIPAESVSRIELFINQDYIFKARKQ